MKNLAVTVVCLIVAAGAIRVSSHRPEITPRVVILPCPAPKSLIEWMELEQTYSDAVPYHSQPHRERPDVPLFYYAGSESPENLIAERKHAGKLLWGPQAIETPYRVAWRGAGWITLEVPADATEGQVAAWQGELERCDGKTVGFEIRRGE